MLSGRKQCQCQACHITDIAAWLQLEEEIQADLKWCMTVEKVLHSGRSDFQSVELIESGPFGKVSNRQGDCAAFAQWVGTSAGLVLTEQSPPSACWAALRQPAQ